MMNAPQQYTLLNPGPINLSDRVRNALRRPDLCHREPEFVDLQISIRERLLKVYDLPAELYAPVMLTGSGTSAMEAMLTSLVPHNGKALIIENGHYGERLSSIADIYRIDHARLCHDWGKEIDLDMLETQLRQDRHLTHIALVHHETTTGRLNQLADIAKMCKDYGLYLLIDGISSFGAEALDFEDWRIGACAATANKCLHGVPGVSFVMVRRHLLPTRDSQKRTLYLDLETYCRYQDAKNTPFTPSVQTYYALDEALVEFEEQGGWQARHQRYHQLMDRIRTGLGDLGIEALLTRDESSVVLTAFKLPEGIAYDTLHDQLKEKGFVIYAGQGQLAKSIFRISIMGSISQMEIERLIDVIKEVTRVHG